MMLKIFWLLAILFTCAFAETLQTDSENLTEPPNLDITNSTNQKSYKEYTSRISRSSWSDCLSDVLFKFIYDDTFQDVINDMKFVLNLKKKKDKILTLNDKIKLTQSGFNKSAKTVIITHGWLMTKDDLAVTKIRNAYLRNNESFNIISVDWSEHSQNIRYDQAADSVKSVGYSVAKMINFLHSEGMDCSKLTLVGHSLGAHVMGIAGKNTVESCKVARVVGLDPARPFFSCAKPKYRISRKSATHVEIIHTNGQNLGLQSPKGHADFYVNGGMMQPACDNSLLVGQLLEGSLEEVWVQAAMTALVSVVKEDFPKIICSHMLAVLLYAESINSKVGFLGKKCNLEPSEWKGDGQMNPNECRGDFVQMGGTQTASHERGMFYLTTNNSSPFAVGKNRPHTVSSTSTFLSAFSEQLTSSVKNTIQSIFQ